MEAVLQELRQLRAANERLQMALSGSGVVGLWDWMVDTDLLHGDANFARLYGLDVVRTAAGLTEAQYQEHVVAEDLRPLRARIRDVFDRGAAFLVDYRLAIPGEATRWVECKGQMIADEAGRPVRFSGTAIDITERHRSEEALKHLNDTLEQRVAERTDELNFFWNASPDLLLLIDFDGVLRRVNPAWTTLLGYAPDELVGHHVNKFVVGDDHTETVDAYKLAANGGSPRVVNRYRHKDGTVRWVSWVAAPRGSITYALGRDVTAERQHAAALAETEEALRQAQKMEAVGQLTGGLAHDFNNLLAGISGSLELMSVRISQGRLRDVERYMIAAQGAAKRAAALTHRLLAFSRRQTLAPKVTDVNGLIDGMLDLVQRTVGPSIEVQSVELLLAAAERRIGMADRLARLIADPRNPLFVTHSVADILRARMLAIACGYEDADDLDHLRTDPGFKLACGRLPDSGRDLCSQPTVSRWENAPTLREIVRLSYAMIDTYCSSYARPPVAVTLDIDDTVDVVHGHQQLSLFNA